MAVKKNDSAKQNKKQAKPEEKEEVVKATSNKQQVTSKKKMKAEDKKETKVKKTSKKETKKVKKEVKKTTETKEEVKVTEEVSEETKQIPMSENKPDEGLARVVIEETLKEKSDFGQVKKLTKQPNSMDELMELTGYKLQGLKKGQEILATITDKSKKTVYFDIGAKTEGILIEKEMPYVEDYIKFLNVGDTISATIVSPENEKGQILLSVSRSANDWKWSLFQKYMDTESQVEVRGLDINKGGMIARLMNVRGFIPVSQFGRKWVGNLDKLYNKVFPVKIIEVDKEKNRLIFSEKAVSEAMVLEMQEELLNEVKVGETYKGQISGVMPFGIFVRVIVGEGEKKGFLDGLVHISEISWEKVNNVSTMFKVGQEIDIQLIDVDKNSGKLNLSIKRLQKDPWDDIADKYQVETKCKATITRIAAFGVFAEIEKGIEGLIHISKIPSDNELKVGDKVDCYIETLDKENHRISLGLVLSAKPVGYK